MGIEEAAKAIEAKAFFKTSSQILKEKNINITPSQKVQLIRKANELFNDKSYSKAKELFILTNYSDGLVRMGDYYMENEDFIEALKMYCLSKVESKITPLALRAANIIQSMIKEKEEDGQSIC